MSNDNLLKERINCADQVFSNLTNFEQSLHTPVGAIFSQSPAMDKLAKNLYEIRTPTGDKPANSYRRKRPGQYDLLKI